MIIRLTKSNSGFTLIELSIVLVIIGLIVGGVLVGQDLIEAAAIRATISQIEKYGTAVNAFKIKFNALPGDMASSQAASLGFIARGGGACDGDGDGILCGLNINGFNTSFEASYLGGETVFFWTDLSDAQMIDNYFHDASDVAVAVSVVTDLSRYLPRAKVGSNTFVSAFSSIPGTSLTGRLAFEIATRSTNSGVGQPTYANGGLSPIEAFSIDSKIDDGFPLSGTTVAGAAGFNALTLMGEVAGPPSFATATSSAYCVSAAPYTYNVQYNNQYCSLIIQSP